MSGSSTSTIDCENWRRSVAQSKERRALLERVRDDIHHGDVSKRNVLRLIDVVFEMEQEIERLERRVYADAR
jgi:hypothetical protein